MKSTKMIWPSWPQYGREEEEAVVRVIRSNQLFADQEVKRFEEQFSEYMGVKFALGLGNATQGLHLALAALDIGEGDEVLVTSYSWISTASCILMQNAVPVFCDIEEKSLGLAPNEIEKRISSKTKAIILTHIFGYPARISEILSIAKKHTIPVIEDASHAHGAELNGKKIGSFGDIGVFSLHQRKSLSVGDGGVLITNNSGINEKVFRLRSFGHDELSFNYRMTEFAGALAQVGLKKLEKQNNVRRENAAMLYDLLKENEYLKVKCPHVDEKGVFYAVLIEVKKQILELDHKLSELQKLGIPIRKTWRPLHQHPHFNPQKKIARGLPWLQPNYNGQMRNLKYNTIELSKVEYYCPNHILEIYVHPPVNSVHIRFAYEKIKQFLL
jgi:perosamine synthetase